MTDAIEALRGQLVLLHSLANDTTEANWRDKRLYILQTCVRMLDALAALDAETPVTPADVGEEPVAWTNARQLGFPDGMAGSFWPTSRKAGMGHSAIDEPLYSATALERVVRERGEALKARDFYEQRSLENNMLAHKWMAAHDALHAKKPYKFPAPVDLPDALARAESAEAKLAEARKVIEPFAAEAPYWQGFGDYQQITHRAHGLEAGHLRAARRFLEETK